MKNRIMKLADEYAECVKNYTMLHPLREQAHAALKAEVERIESVPMKYKRMTFNAELQQRIAELESENERLAKAWEAKAASEVKAIASEREVWNERETLRQCIAELEARLQTQQAELTDRQIDEVWMLNGGGLAANRYHDFARAVLAAQRGKA